MYARLFTLVEIPLEFDLEQKSDSYVTELTFNSTEKIFSRSPSIIETVPLIRYQKGLAHTFFAILEIYGHRQSIRYARCHESEPNFI